MKKTLFMSAAFAAFALPAIAQEATEDETRVESPIVVTLPGQTRTADELIGNATVLERDELLDTLDTSLGNTLANEPGVSTTFFGPASSRPVIRGLGSERVLVLTNSLGVIDASAASPDHQVTGDAIDAERIEVLRGPAALAYGGQAIGGVVNVIDGLISEDVPDAPNGDVLAAYNSVNEGSEFAGRGEFAAGQLVFNLSASYRDGDNYDIPDFAESALQRALEEAEEEEGEEHEEEEEVRGTVENSFLETTSLAGGASWVGENAFFGVAVRQTDSEYGLPGGHGHHEEEHEEGEEEGEEHEEEEESPFIDLSHTRIDVRGGVVFEGAPISKVTGAASFSDYEHTEFEGPGEVGTEFENQGHEVRIEATHAPIGAFHGAFGIQQSNQDFSAIGAEAFVSPTETERFAVFVYETAEFEGFGLEGGLRIENADLTNMNPNTGVTTGRDFDTWSASIGVHSHVNDNVFVGLQLSSTERAPTDVELFANGPHMATGQFEIGNADLDIESGLNLEGTVRFTLDNLSFGVNAFSTNFDNFIFLSPDGTEEDELPVFNFVQQDASFHGAEFYADANVNSLLDADWVFSASVDWVDSRPDDGGNVPLQPPTTASLGAEADWGAFAAGVSITHAGDQNTLAASELATDGYTLVDLRAEYDISAFAAPLAEGSKLFIEARNVTDEEARIATSTIKDFAPLPGQNIRFGIRASF